MSILFWRRKNPIIDGFAKTAADELFSFVDPDAARSHFQEESKQKKKKQINTARRIDEVVLKLNDFGRENSLGIYGKARLQQQFSNRLIELGYDNETTRKLVQTVLYQSIS